MQAGQLWSYRKKYGKMTLLPVAMSGSWKYGGKVKKWKLPDELTEGFIEDEESGNPEVVYCEEAVSNAGVSRTITITQSMSSTPIGSTGLAAPYSKVFRPNIYRNKQNH